MIEAQRRRGPAGTDPQDAILSGSMVLKTKEKVTPEEEKVNPIMTGGLIRISGPEFKTQDVLLRDVHGAEELELELRKSKEKETRVRLSFNFSDCDVEITNEVQDLEFVGGDDFCFTVGTPAEEHVALILSVSQAAAVKRVLENYLTAYAANADLKKEIIIKKEC